MGLFTMETSKHQTCIDACSKCAQACYECFHQCLNEPDLEARKDCVSMLVECAMMCQMSVSMMAMNGQFSKEHCSLCAKICDSCAQECNMFQDDHCQDCAQACKRCAEECRSMAGM
ncbi:MAG TPA: four-helix bundle copper-binding protein [Lachnospiraceae bacterium]|nr:four-helix bundle copper-binding protein [Lachnospiraceae bacterium]